jgi:hypothetical protein
MYVVAAKITVEPVASDGCAWWNATHCGWEWMERNQKRKLRLSGLFYLIHELDSCMYQPIHTFFSLYVSSSNVCMEDRHQNDAHAMLCGSSDFRL